MAGKIVMVYVRWSVEGRAYTMRAVRSRLLVAGVHAGNQQNNQNKQNSKNQQNTKNKQTKNER